MIKKLFLIVLALIIGFNQPALSQKISSKKKLEKTRLKRGLNYSTFTSNNSYLAWTEFYARKIYIYNLKKGEIEAVIGNKGRGPHEYIMISSLTLTKENKLVITDPENIKLIIYNLNANSYEQDVKFENLRPYRVSFKNGSLFLSTILLNSESLYYLFSMYKGKPEVINMTELNSKKELSYPFKTEGYIASNHLYGIHLTRYYPHIYVVNLHSRQVQKRIVFEEGKVKKGKTTTIKGNKAFLPPEDVDVLNKDVAFLPNSDNSILILAEGKGEQRSYDPGKLRVYDFIEEEFMNILDIGVNATKITVNDDYLFVYSEEENAIFQYDIVPEE